MAGVSREADIKEAAGSIQTTLDAVVPKAGGKPMGSTVVTIFPIPSFVRQANLRDYKPAILSIGPYHRDDRKLKGSNNNKIMFLHDLLSRAKDKSLNDCVATIMELEPNARNYYEDTDKLRLPSKELVEMLVLDGCFIIELLYRFRFKGRESTLPVGWSRRTVWIDLLKLENQIPFFVLQALFDLLLLPEIKKYFSGWESRDVLIFLSRYYLTSKKLESLVISYQPKPQPSQEVDHLLHLYLRCLTPDRWQESQHRILPQTLSPADRLRILADILVAMIFSPHRLLTYIWRKALAWFRGQQPLPLTELERSNMTIPCATQLEEDGVKITKERKCTTLFEITFNRHRGIMHVPQMSIDRETMTLFANLIHYEQRKGQKKYVISYAFLMDCLVNSPKDVAALREREIIVSDQEDKQLADFFNDVCRSCDLTKDSYCYADLSDEVNEYCKSKLFRWRAYFTKLKRDYFGNPWALVSFLAAVVLLCLTIAQTFFTAYPYYHP